MTPTYASYRKAAASSLSQALSLDPRIANHEVDHLACQALGRAPHELLLEEGQPIAPTGRQKLDCLLAERLAGKPLALVLGCQEFHDLTIKCSPAALVPRPETELLVSEALGRLDPSLALVIADLGTGTGAIALALAHHLPHAHVWALEKSPAASAVARANITALGFADRVELHQADWHTAPTGLDLVASNPPYVTTGTCAHMELQGTLADPREALDGGSNGLVAIMQVLAIAKRSLKPGGLLLLEHGLGQHHAVVASARGNGLEPVGCVRDLQGLKRIFCARQAEVG